MTLTQRTWTEPPRVRLHSLLHQLFQPTQPQAGMALAPYPPLPVCGAGPNNMATSAALLLGNIMVWKVLTMDKL